MCAEHLGDRFCALLSYSDGVEILGSTCPVPWDQNPANACPFVQQTFSERQVPSQSLLSVKHHAWGREEQVEGHCLPSAVTPGE